MKRLLPLLLIFLCFSAKHAAAQKKMGRMDSLMLKVDSAARDSNLVEEKKELAEEKKQVFTNADTLDIPMLTMYMTKPNLYKKSDLDSIELHSPFKSVTDDALQASLKKNLLVSLESFKSQFKNDTLRAGAHPRLPSNISSLKRQVGLVTNDTLKAMYYHMIANYYLKYDSITVGNTKQAYQNTAIDFTVKAIHAYSRYNDSNGLRSSFDNLTKVYNDQGKFSQAKWFILQSNTLARAQRDIPNIISSLVTLANIKMQISDYALAKRDLDEALSLATQHHFTKQESAVQAQYASLYDAMNEPQKSLAAAKRHNFLDDSIAKAAARRLAAAKDSTDQAKKKLLTEVDANKKSSHGITPASSKKTVTL